MGLRNKTFTSMSTLFIGDLFLATGVFFAGLYLRFGTFQAGMLKYQPLYSRLIPFVMFLMLCSFFMELYGPQNIFRKKETTLRCMITSFFSFFILSSLYYVFPITRVWRGHLITSLALFPMLQILWHISYGLFLSLPGFAKRVLILGVGHNAQKLGKLISATNHHYVFSGYISCPSEALAVPAYHVVGDHNNILETAMNQHVHKIVISLSEKRGVLPLKSIMNCKFSGIDILDAPSFYEEITGKLFLEDLKPSWFIFSDGFRITNFKKNNKRIFDIVISFLGLVATAPMMPVIALLIKANSPGPAFFRQVRVGERDKNFVLSKFRTMNHNAEEDTGAVWAQENDGRITKVGRILRTMRLDELPQLYNVLKGDMSLIGPRPERPEFVEKLKEIILYYPERHFVKPGITGWAQVKFSYGASVDDAIEKLRYDLYYVKNFSLILDLLIVLETIKVVIFGKGSR